MSSGTIPERQAGRGHPVAGVVLAILGGVFWLVPVGLAVFVVPKFAEIFRKFDFPGGVPPATGVVLAVGQSVQTWWPVAGFLWGIAVGVLIALCAVVRARWPAVLAAAFAGVSLLGVVASMGVVAVTLLLPLAQMIHVTPAP